MPEAKCAAAPKVRGKARQRFDLAAFITVASEVEGPGERNVRLPYEKPETECLLETFQVKPFNVSAVSSPWKKGLRTVYYRFVADGPEEDREILVLYSGNCGFMNKGYCFHVAEARGDVVSWYAMFREEPPYAPLKEVVSSVLGGTAKPLLAIQWPKGEKEGWFIPSDSGKLK